MNDDLPPVYQPPIERTIQTRFVSEGEHKPMPFPEDVAELVRRVRHWTDDGEWIFGLSLMLADACERLAAENARYREALTQIASYGEGPVVNGSFDSPVDAAIARAALTPATEKR